MVDTSGIKVRNVTLTPAQIEEWNAAIRKERSEARAAARYFVDACRSGDVGAMQEASEHFAFLAGYPWHFVMLTLGRGAPVHPDAAAAFLTIWVQTKSMLREVEAIPLIKGLRALFPPYDGPAIKVYRGETLAKATKGKCGISWTTDPEVAEEFAKDSRQVAEGGSCVIETWAFPEAIIGSTALVGDFYNEREILIDRRRLGRIGIFKRFDPIGREEYLAHVRAVAAAAEAGKV